MWCAPGCGRCGAVGVKVRGRVGNRIGVRSGVHLVVVGVVWLGLGLELGLGLKLGIGLGFGVVCTWATDRAIAEDLYRLRLCLKTQATCRRWPGGSSCGGNCLGSHAPEEHCIFTQWWSVTGSIGILLVDGRDRLVSRRGSGWRRDPDINP